MSAGVMRTARAQARYDEILSLVKANPGIFIAEAAEATGSSPTSIGNALRAMVEKRIIFREQTVVKSPTTGRPCVYVRFFVGTEAPAPPPVPRRAVQRDELVAALFGPAGGPSA